MAQQPNATSQVVFGPVNNSGDIIHYIPVTSNPTGPNLLGWVDKNGALQGVSFVVNALQQSAAAPITGAAGGVFSYSSNGLQVSANLPGSGAMEQVPFVVKAGGYISLGAGTYTASVQPLLYASTTPGFTAAAANAIYSPAAVGWTITSATPVSAPFEIEAHLVGDSTSGKILGWNQGLSPSAGTGGTGSAVAIAAIANAPTSVTFSAAIPVQFAFGVTLSTTAVASSVVNLGSFIIES